MKCICAKSTLLECFEVNYNMLLSKRGMPSVKFTKKIDVSKQCNTTTETSIEVLIVRTFLTKFIDYKLNHKHIIQYFSTEMDKTAEYFNSV